MSSQKKAVFISLFLIIILGFAVYANSLNGKFIWDDNILIRDNVYIKKWSNLPNIFSEDIGAGSSEKFYFYRPFTMLVHMIDYSLWKLNVAGYHLTNIFLHILVALAIYWLINILYHNNFISLLTGIFFVANPIHTEAVTYISGRADSLVTLFVLLTFIFYIKYLHTERISLYIFALLCYIFALLSRENSLITPAILYLYHYAFQKKARFKKILPFLIITLTYILLRITLLRSLLAHLSCHTTLFQRIPGFLVAITNYLRLIFLPFNLHMEYGNTLFKFSNPRAMLGIAALLFLLIYAFKRRKSDSLFFFSVSWFFLTLLPSSNLYPLNAYMAEHWLYLPAIGFFLILAKAINSLCQNRKLKVCAIISGIFLLIFYSFLTIRQNTYWQEPLAFYEWTLRYASNSPTLNNNLAALYQGLGEIEKAEALYKKAIEINPEYVDAYNNLGWAYHELGNTKEAIVFLQKAIQINPKYAAAYSNLGLLYHELGNTKEAIVFLQEAIQINPHYANAYNNLATLYQELGRIEEAGVLYKKAIELNPYQVRAYNNLACLYSDIGRSKEAIALYKKAIQINPHYANAYNNLATLYQKLGRIEEAEALYDILSTK